MMWMLTMALAATCQVHSVRCQCAPAVPFEGYQISIVEKCDGKEDWYTRYGQRQFSTQEDCEKAIPEDFTCKTLPGATDSSDL